MSEFNEFQPENRKPLSNLQLFALKILILVVAVDSMVVFSASFMRTQYEKAIHQTLATGGVWKNIEALLYRLADEEDVPPEKKAKILSALQKLSIKYSPYIEALAPTKKTNPP